MHSRSSSMRPASDYLSIFSSFFTSFVITRYCQVRDSATRLEVKNGGTRLGDD